MKQETLLINAASVSLVPEELLDYGLLAQAQTILERGITNDTQADEVIRMNDTIKDKKKKNEAARALKVGPFNEFVKGINDWFRPYRTALEDLETKLGQQYAKYFRDKQAEIDRLQREANALAEAERKRLEKKTEKARETALFDDEVPASPAPAPAPRYEAPKPAAPIQRILKVRVITPNLVPDRFKVISEALLLAAHKDGETKIPGVEFYSKDIVKRSGQR